MKRWLCLLCAIALLAAGCTGCKKEPDPSPIEPITYTSFPTELSIDHIGVLPQNCVTAEGGLYYRIGEKYGIMSFDGTCDSGAIYTMCRPFGDAFMVAKSMAIESDLDSFNTAGVVDARGNVLIPLAYASVNAVDGRFARVAEITGTAADEDESITDFTASTGDKVYCAGNWYIYDLITGKKVPGATGTKPYACYSYGGKYIKYVTDDKQQHVTTPEGDPLPDEAAHLKNGYYALRAENAVYDPYGKKMFTYDPNGYVPCDDQNSAEYILAKKTVDGKDAYVLMDLTGAVVSGELEAEPVIRGPLLLINKKVYNFKGEQLIPDEGNNLYMDSVTKQAWMITNATTKEKFLLDKDGKVMYRSGAEDVTFNVNNFNLHKKDGENDPDHLILKDNAFSVKGTSVAPWLVKTVNEDGTYNLIETISGKTLLSNCVGLSVAVADGTILYVYTQNAEGVYEIYRVR